MVSEERQKRLADNMARLAAEILQLELKHPLPGVVTVTRATVTRDLSRLRVFYTFLGSDSEGQEARRRLRQVASFVQRQVAQRLHLRVTPSLEFVFDDSVEKTADVLRLLAELKDTDGSQTDDST